MRVPVGESARTHPYPEVLTRKSAPGLPLGGGHSVGLDTCLMPWLHHQRVIQSVFTAPKSLCAPTIHPSSPSKPLEPVLFVLSPYLPSPECRVAGSIQHGGFSDWLLPVTDMHGSFLRGFHHMNDGYCSTQWGQAESEETRPNPLSRRTQI